MPIVPPPSCLPGLAPLPAPELVVGGAAWLDAYVRLVAWAAEVMVACR